MENEVRSWLPKEAITAVAVDRLLAGPVGDWSQRWFARATATVAVVAGGPDLPSSNLDVMANAVFTKARLFAIHKTLAVKALTGSEDSSAFLNARDHEVLSSLLEKVLLDLLEGIEKVLFPVRCLAGEPCHTVQIAISEGAFVDVLIPDIALIPPIKNSIPLANADHPLELRSDALLRAPLALYGYAGAISLSVEEAGDLVPGDILLLYELEKPVELHCLGGEESIATGKLFQSNGRISIEIESVRCQSAD